MTTPTQPDPHLVQQLLLHGIEVEDPSAWALEPTVIAGVFVFVAVYLHGLRRLSSGRELPRWRVYLFLLGSLIFLLTLISPLDVLSDGYLFSAHMVQHILLTAIVPPLWLLGTPEWLLSPLLRPHRLFAVARFFTRPAIALPLFHVVYWLWHLPALYDFALDHEAVHAFQHLTFVGAGVLNWWPVLGPVRALPRLSYPLQVMYLFINCQPGVALGAFFVFSKDVLYDVYAAAPRLFGMSAIVDQQVGGLIMWIPGNGIYLLALSLVFFKWLLEDKRGTDLSR